LQNIKKTLIIDNIVLYYQSCGVKVSKTKVERLSGVGVWPVNPSTWLHNLTNAKANLEQKLRRVAAKQKS
jgi:hypothetical protein